MLRRLWALDLRGRQTDAAFFSGYRGLISLAITITFGLTCGTILTMVVVPTFYATLYRLNKPDNKSQQDVSEAQQQPV